MEEIIDEDKDVARRILKNFLRLLVAPSEYKLERGCFNCSTVVLFREQKFVNTIIDDLKDHCIKHVESGGEIDPAICPHCGALNEFGNGGMGGAVMGYQLRPVAGIVKDAMWAPDPEDYDSMIMLPVESKLLYRQVNKNRPPITRVEWIDYFKVDPAVALRNHRGSLKRRDMATL